MQMTNSLYSTQKRKKVIGSLLYSVINLPSPKILSEHASGTLLFSQTFPR